MKINDLVRGGIYSYQAIGEDEDLVLSSGLCLYEGNKNLISNKPLITDCSIDFELATESQVAEFMSWMMDNNKILHCGFDSVENPEYYTKGKIECIDAMISAFGKKAVKWFCKCNAFKYIWRSENKNGNEDIKKAMWYQEKYLELDKSE